MAPEYWRRATVLSTAATTVIGMLAAEPDQLGEGRVGLGVDQLAEVVDDDEHPRAEPRGDVDDVAHQLGAAAPARGRPCPRTARGRAASGGTWTWNSGRPWAAAAWAIVASVVVRPLRGGPVTRT